MTPVQATCRCAESPTGARHAGVATRAQINRRTSPGGSQSALVMINNRSTRAQSAQGIDCYQSCTQVQFCTGTYSLQNTLGQSKQSDFKNETGNWKGHRKACKPRQKLVM